VPPEAMPQLEKLARLAGARLVLRELAHKKTVKPSGTLDLEMRWANVGVGKLYRPYVLRFSLVDAEGRVCFSADAKTDPRQWLPGEHLVTESLQMPATLRSGEYDLAVSLVDPARPNRRFQLAIDAQETEGRYFVSRLAVPSRSL